MKRKTRISRALPKWIPPTSEPKFTIGSRVMVKDKSILIPIGTVGTVYGVIYKVNETNLNYSGYWYDINFDGFISHHIIAEFLLMEGR